LNSKGEKMIICNKKPNALSRKYLKPNGAYTIFSVKNEHRKRAIFSLKYEWALD
jgi:hypothetical protein